MNEVSKYKKVLCAERQVVIPTYPIQAADPNPMFFENRVYQGSNGKVYPNPFTDRVALEKVNATYRAIFLENEYIQLMLLPEIGGRIFAGLDKTNQYDFFTVSTLSSQPWSGCWAPGSPVALSSIGRSTTALRHSCLSTRPSSGTPMAVARFGSASTIQCCA